MVRWTSFPVVVTWMMIIAETTTAGTATFFFLDARTMMGNGWVHDFREFAHPILVRYIVDCFAALAVVGRSRCISHFCEGSNEYMRIPTTGDFDHVNQFRKRS